MLVGSFRKASFNRRAAHALSGLAPEALRLGIVEIGQLPHYNQDADDEGAPPAPRLSFRKTIGAADAVLFVTPEYNRSVPGVLKNAIDVGSRPYGQSVWSGKPAAVMSVSPGAIGGFGAWAIGGSGWEFGWGSQNDRDSVAAIREALDAGINWIDTAAAYGLGHSEEVVARALEGVRARPYIFTKCSMVWDEHRTIGHSLEAHLIRRECEASLRRLKVDAIDLYQIHWPNPDQDIEEGWATMAALQSEGKVRNIGVSNFSIAQMKRAQAIAPIASLQPRYSLLHREIEPEILPFVAKESIGVIAYSPIASGLLTGAMTRERIAALPVDDWRRGHEDFREPQLTRNLETVSLLRTIGNRHGRSPAEVVIAWVLRPPTIAGVAGAADFRLDAGERAEIDRVLPIQKAA